MVGSTKQNGAGERLKKLVTAIERHKKIIATRRDKLRELVEDVNSIVESLDRADNSLENGARELRCGVDEASEYL